MISQNESDNQRTIPEELAEIFGPDDKLFVEQLNSLILQVFSDFVQRQEFTNSSNKDMVMTIGKIVSDAYAHLVLAFKVSLWVPDLKVSMNAFKMVLDACFQDLLKKQTSTTLSDMEDVGHNVL